MQLMYCQISILYQRFFLRIFSFSYVVKEPFTSKIESLEKKGGGGRLFMIDHIPNT